MDKKSYVCQLMVTRLSSKYADKLVEACLVYWHSGISIADAAVYLSNYQLQLTRGSSGTRD